MLPILLLSITLLSLICLGWLGGWLLFIVRPRNLLVRLADELERGQATLFEGGIGYQPEINAILRSTVSNDKKAKAVADLLPTLQSGRFFHNQLFLNLAGLYLLISAFALGGYWVLSYIVPRYRDIYLEFGISLPMLTAGLIRISDLFEAIGAPGLFALLLMIGGGLVCLALIFGTRFAVITLRLYRSLGATHRC